MNKIITEEIGSFNQHYPKVAAVITASAGGKRDAMTAAWHTAISREPAIYCVSMAPSRFTYELIAQSKEFGINFMPNSKTELVAAVGGSKGREIDKFKTFGIALDKAAETSVPVLADAYCTYECRLMDDRLYADHRLLVGEVVAVHYDKKAFMPDGRLALGKISPVVYMGAETYINVARCRGRRFDRNETGEKLKSQSKG